jgi:hypothetical protein
MVPTASKRLAGARKYVPRFSGFGRRIRAIAGLLRIRAEVVELDGK